MSFWDLSDGETVKGETEYEAPSGGGFDPLPHNTDVMGFIDEIKWGDKDGATPIDYRITVVKPEAYKNRKLFFKLWPMGDSPYFDTPEKKKKGADKGKRFLAAMDANAGGELMQVQGRPSDEELQRCLMQKMMVFKVGHMEPKAGAAADDKGMNYLMAVSPKSKGVAEGPAQQQSGGGNPNAGRDLDDEIPF